MVKIDEFILGYRKLKIEPSDLSLVSGILLKASIPSSINNDGTITVRERDFEKINELFSGRVVFSYSKPLGIRGFLKRIKNKNALLFAAIISSFLIALFSSLVWDIRVDGNVSMTDSEVVLALSDLDFRIGDFWSGKNLGKIEASFLKNNDRVSWININRRGTVAYIKIIEKEENKNVDDNTKEGYSNIIANADCVIEEITVKAGIAVVKPGDVVKKGDLLIVGILPEESGGGFCNAEASVVGRVSDTIKVEIDRNSIEKSCGNKKLYSYSIKIFNFSLNIFKLYGNLTKECDIIEDEVKYTLFGRCKLPISINKQYIIEEENYSVVYTDDELVKIASARLSSLVASRLATADLLKLRTEGRFTDTGYTIRSEIIFLCEVGSKNELLVE